MALHGMGVIRGSVNVGVVWMCNIAILKQKPYTLTTSIQLELKHQFFHLGLCNTHTQCRSYTWAFPGLCPRKIRWCPGKNNVESESQRSVISMCDCKFHVHMKQAYR